ncbi:MAG: hypothetical protein ABWY06_09785 [Pseudomonas sp.]|uniref:hypothetical protein n=1 Tax=Pseudomonas sp. TaxID=306 RepID=UPI003391A0E4
MPSPSHRPWLSLVFLLLITRASPLVAAELFYLGQPIPDIQRPWTSADYQDLISALAKIDSDQADALPRRSGEFTGPIYQRLVSEENFRGQLNIYAPLEERQNEAREVLFRLKDLMRLYFNFRAAVQPYGAEALGLMTHSLRQQAVLFTLTTEFWTTLSAKEQRNPVRLQGLQDTKAAAAMLTASALDYLMLTAQFNREDLVRYGAELSQQLPALFVHLRAEVRGELLARIARMANEHPYAEVRASLSQSLPVLQVLQADIQAQLGQSAQATQPARTGSASGALDLSLPSVQ